MRLNTINHLRVRRPNQNEQNPCVVVMSSMLSMFCSSFVARLTLSISRCHLESRNREFVTDNISFRTDCWASAGYGAEGCAALETQLRKCMDAPVRYNPPPFFSFIVDIPLTSFLPHIEIQGAEEEHCQLPPHENVPQGCWPPEEGRCSRLKYSLHWIVRDCLSGLGSRSVLSWSFGFLFDTLLREYSGLHQDLLIWSAYFASEAMGVGFYSYVQYTTMWDMESPFRTIDHTFIYLLDREVTTTGKIKVHWVDEHGQCVWDNVMEADNIDCLSLALEDCVSLAEILNWQAVRGALIVK